MGLVSKLVDIVAAVAVVESADIEGENRKRGSVADTVMVVAVAVAAVVVDIVAVVEVADIDQSFVMVAVGHAIERLARIVDVDTKVVVSTVDKPEVVDCDKIVELNNH